jgi:hypothetical protein
MVDGLLILVYNRTGNPLAIGFKWGREGVEGKRGWK